jgi:hypothetical protein
MEATEKQPASLLGLLQPELPVFDQLPCSGIGLWIEAGLPRLQAPPQLLPAHKMQVSTSSLP